MVIHSLYSDMYYSDKGAMALMNVWVTGSKHCAIGRDFSGLSTYEQ